MITPYLRPQDTITQLLRATASPQTNRRNPIVIGPEYRLMLNDGRDVAEYDFAAAGATKNYEIINGTELDLTAYTPHAATAELHADGVQALVASFGSGLWEVDESVSSLRAIRVKPNTIAGSGTLHVSLDGRPVRVGDVIHVAATTNSNPSTARRAVVGLLGVVTPAEDAEDLVKSAAPDAAVTNATDDGHILASATTAGYVFFDHTAADNLDFRRHGRTYLDASGNRKLGDELTMVCTTAGIAGVAEFSVSSSATGQTATILSDDAGSGEFSIDLTTVGYDTAIVTAQFGKSGGSATVGDIVKMRIFPAYTATDLTTGMTVGGAYTGGTNRRYVVEITGLDGAGTAAAVRVFDTAGTDIVTTDTDATDGAAMGAGGLTVTIGVNPSLYVGQKLYVDAVAAIVSTTEFDGVVLDGPAISGADYAVTPDPLLTAVTVFQPYTGKLDNSNHDDVGDVLTMGADDWSYAASLGLPQADTGLDSPGISPFADGFGKVILSYKALRIPAALESTFKFTTSADISAEHGELHKENWLAMGAYESLKGNQSVAVYTLRTAGDTVEAFTAALNKIRQTDQFYALAVMTDSLDVQQLVADHCTEMSGKYKKNFRRCYVGTDSPGEYLYWGALAGGGYRTATLDSGVVTLHEDYRDAWQFSNADVGSSMTILALGQSYEITEVLSAYECVIDADVDLEVATPSGITITRPDTAEATAHYVADRSIALANRRCVNVWVDNGTDEDGILPNKFVAAEIAGLRCALLVQQGLTMTEILSVTSAPGMYARFTPEQLDFIAANGTMIVTQESEGGDVFIRHQLTTDATAGEALRYEDNVGVIVDEFSYAVKDTFREYIGRRNATPDTIAEIDDKLKLLANDFTRTDLASRYIGPPVLTFFDEKGNEGEVTVRQDGNLADTIMTYVNLRVPLPLNGINHYIDVEAVELLQSADN